MLTTLVDITVIEEAEVLARGLLDFAEHTVAKGQVRHLTDVGGYAPAAGELVVCGPSALRAFAGWQSDASAPVACVAVVADASRVDFAALLGAGMDVLWDYRGTRASFGLAATAALRGQPWVHERLTGAMASDIGVQLRRGLHAADYGLTARESEILHLMATGSRNRDIAADLFISENTVKNHVRAVLDKLHAATRTEAVMIGARMGLIEVRHSRG